ncbi:hypothetical protein [Stakelama tenebrarum]|uniref:Protein kinase domain-containing protein n=1 Tax=Stakelama tenebrarum TaxID=2711215 RepID=A0A6G6Y4D2_9SPHN|nr:hypothetical protein [Sphingosinithalassobacter tenebrarum]QIG79760.1 hypothetical protein G5C33_08115 [Sphingosinithalassobacter tenebrarum]
MSEIYLGTGAKQRPLRLGKLLGEGAAGKVYSIPEMPGSAAKIYHGEAECRRYEAKIDRMLANPPDLSAAVHEGVRYPQIAWPEAKLYDKARRFIGFLMPEIDFRRSTSLVNLLQKNSRRVEKLSDYYGYRVLVARNLASVFAELHRAGHHMIDMKPANLRFYPAVSWMAVVDTDGFSIAGSEGRIPAEQVSDEYIAPESWKQEPAALGEAQDQFALAVIIFQLLNNGVHPFAGKAAPGTPAQPADIQSRILKGLYPYGASPPDDVVPSAASIHKSFRRATRSLFDRAFMPGQARPDAAEWRDHLDTLISQLVPCPAKPKEHAHFGMGCGFCAHDARIEASAQSAPRRPPRRTAMARPAGATRPRPGQAVALRRMPHPGKGIPLRAHRRRRSGALGGMAAIFAVLLLGTVLIGQQWIALPLRAGGIADGEASAAQFQAAADRSATGTIDGRAADAQIDTFETGREFLVLPGDGKLTADLRDGPGQDFALVSRLSLYENVIGRGTSVDAEGVTWVWIVRERDGSPGFVPEAALVPNEADFESDIVDYGSLCSATIPGSRPRYDCAVDGAAKVGRQVAHRYRDLIDSTRGFDRISLTEQRQRWGAELRECGLSVNAEACRLRVNRRHYEQLDSAYGADPEARRPTASALGRPDDGPVGAPFSPI